MQSIGNLLWRPTFDPLAITTMRLVAANKCRLLGAGDFPSLRVANGTFQVFLDIFTQPWIHH
ncbi:hypothetical protein BMF29_04595 [Comamonas kerstersii]|uniref:Uncharacterized protein n=1 Tax=Comamonas kerstersii TaxID=225992 RepID=A0A0W7YSI9_9BURK|nr:hypothetical protein AS359_04810 [Comamonas kerstersii]OOH88066.1 hypothetical protein BMF38_02860 [Comamonas kerstersii]OOH94587.1 hypothetical protein BMF29_04595 [Comamonas kerstersii]